MNPVGKIGLVLTSFIKWRNGRKLSIRRMLFLTELYFGMLQSQGLSEGWSPKSKLKNTWTFWNVSSYLRCIFEKEKVVLRMLMFESLWNLNLELVSIFASSWQLQHFSAFIPLEAVAGCTFCDKGGCEYSTATKEGCPFPVTCSYIRASDRWQNNKYTSTREAWRESRLIWPHRSLKILTGNFLYVRITQSEAPPKRKLESSQWGRKGVRGKKN